MSLPKSIVVFHAYGAAVYFDGTLKQYFGVGSGATDGWANLCNLIGIKFRERSVRWEDWPGQDKDPEAVYHPPENLAVLEEHFKKLEEKQRLQRIEQLKTELAQLEGRA